MHEVSSEEEQIVAPPLPPCTLYPVSSGLSEVLSCLKRAADRGYRYVLTLDQHKVSDRFAAQTRELLLAPDRERTGLCLVLYSAQIFRAARQQRFVIVVRSRCVLPRLSASSLEFRVLV